MPALVIDNIKSDLPRTNIFRDVRLDFEPNDIIQGKNLYKKQTSTDIQASYDEEAIANSLTNLFTTTPGEKILVPEYGLDLKRFLFSPLTQTTAQNMADTILNGIRRWEPRVNVVNVDVSLDIDQEMFEIELVLSIPILNNRKVSLNGILKENDSFRLT